MIPELLFHYTTNDAFVSILQSKQLHLTALQLSNDWREGRTFKNVVAHSCRSARIPADAQQKILLEFAEFQSLIMGFGFCLTRNKDQLSQWRGYASNASGVSIGFRTHVLEAGALPTDVGFADAQLKRVIYEHDAQVDAIKPFISKLAVLAGERPASASTYLHGGEEALKFYDSAMQDFHNGIRSAFIETIGSIFQFKSPEFAEEAEWRLLHENMLIRINGKNRMRSLSFRASGAKIVPYVPMTFSDKKMTELITEVVLGPRNETPQEVVEALLDRFGLGNVAVSRSTASYR